MLKIDDTFVEKNKNALLEEMAENLTSINSLIASAIQVQPTENPIHELSIMKSVIIAIAQNAGSLTSCFNQFMVFETGNVQEERQIGFKAMLNSDSEK